jgi:hypothetical protein
MEDINKYFDVISLATILLHINEPKITPKENIARNKLLTP